MGKGRRGEYHVGYCSKITTTSEGVTVEMVVVARSTRVGVGVARARRGKRRRRESRRDGGSMMFR